MSVWPREQLNRKAIVSWLPRLIPIVCGWAQGAVVDGCIQCPYHGWEYDGSGNCVKMPSTAFCRGVGVSTLPVSEAEGFVWVWPGQDMPQAKVPKDLCRPPQGFRVRFLQSPGPLPPDCVFVPIAILLGLQAHQRVVADGVIGLSEVNTHAETSNPCTDAAAGREGRCLHCSAHP
jgi:hypothetical protein